MGYNVVGALLHIKIVLCLHSTTGYYRTFGKFAIQKQSRLKKKQSVPFVIHKNFETILYMFPYDIVISVSIQTNSCKSFEISNWGSNAYYLYKNIEDIISKKLVFFDSQIMNDLYQQILQFPCSAT